MKRIWLTGGFLVASLTIAWADLGSCVVFHAKFYLKNGSAFNGCFEVSGYDVSIPVFDRNTPGKVQDRFVFEKFKMQQEQHGQHYQGFGQAEKSFGKIAVFRDLQYVAPRSMYKKRYTDPYGQLVQYGLILPGMVEFLDTTDIVKLVYWHAEHSRRSWLTSEIIHALPGMADSLQSRRYWNMLAWVPAATNADSMVFSDEPYIDGPYSGLVYYNYNARINLPELKRLIRLKPFQEDYKTPAKAMLKRFKRKEDVEFTPKMRWLIAREMEQQWEAYRQWFWAKGIVVMRISGTC